MARGNSRFPAQLWLYLVVTVAALCVVVTRAEVESPRVVNVAIYGAFTDINKTNNKREEYEPERYVSRVSGAVRAFKDINARDGTIIPDLAKPPTCNVYYQYHLVDSVSSFGTAIQQYFYLGDELRLSGQKVDAIVGPARSSVAVGLSTIASVNNVPMVSYSATSPELDDRARNPTFMRTIPSDDAVAESIMSLLQNFEYKEVNLIYVEDSYGKAFKDSLLKYFDGKITLNAFPHRRKNKNSIVHALEGMKEKRLNINIAIIFLEDLDKLLLAAHARNMTGPGTNWIFSDSIGSASDVETWLRKLDNSTAHIVQTALNGTTQVVASGNVETVERYGKFLSEWRKGFVPLDELNALLPGGSLSNDFKPEFKYNHTITREFFAEKDLSNFATFAYDAALAIKLGVEKQCINGTLSDGVDGKMFVSEDIEFPGVSSDEVGILNETGSRSRVTVYFVANNIRIDSNRSVSYVTNSTEWQPLNKSWIVTKEFRFSGGVSTPPLYTDMVEEELNLVDTSTKIGVFTVVALIELMYFALMIWVVKNRKKPVLSASQPLFLLISLTGVILTLSMSFFFGWDETSANVATLSFFCNLQWWGISLGVTLSVCALLVKLYRINKLFAKKNSFRKVKVTSRKMLLVIALVLAFNVILLGLWTGIYPYEYVRVTVKADRFGQVQESFGICSNPNGSYFVYPILVFHILQYIVGGVLAYQARNYSSDFQEAKWISLAVFSQGQLFLIIVPLFLSIAPSATTVFFVCICLTLCVFTLALVVMIFVPKILRLYFGEEEVKTATKQEERLRRLASNPLGPTTASSLQKRLNSARYSSDLRSTTTDYTPLSGKLSFKSDRTLATHQEGKDGGMFAVPEAVAPIASSRLRLQSLRFRKSTARFSVGTQTEDNLESSTDVTIEENSFESRQSKSSDAEKGGNINAGSTSSVSLKLSETSQDGAGGGDAHVSNKILPITRT